MPILILMTKTMRVANRAPKALGRCLGSCLAKGPLYIGTATLTAILAFTALILLPVDVYSAPGSAPKLKKAVPTEKISRSYYEIELAEYLFDTGNYLDTSIRTRKILASDAFKNVKEDPFLAAVSNRVLLLNWLSDLKLHHKPKDRPVFINTPIHEIPGIVDVFEMLYERGDYPGISEISSQLEGSGAEYLSALALYKRGEFRSAEAIVETIEESELIYPYARIMDAQLKVMGNDTESAREYLTEVHASAEDPSLRAEIALKLGYLLFEVEDYSGAGGYLMEIPQSSPLYGRAISALAWSLVKSERFNEVLRTVEGASSHLPLYSRDAQEAMLLKAYSLLRLGKPEKALDTVKATLKAIGRLRSGYNKLYSRRRIPELFLMDMADISVSNNVLTESDDSWILKAVRHNVLLKDEDTLKDVGAYYKALKVMEGSFREKGLKVSGTAALIENRINAKDESIARIKIERGKIEPLLKDLSRRVFQNDTQDGNGEAGDNGEDGETKSVFDQGVFKESGLDTGKIITLWEGLLNRRLTKGEKDVIELVALDGEDGLLYLENTAYSQFLFWMAIDETKNKTSRVKDGRLAGRLAGRLERILIDLSDLHRGVPIKIATLLPELEEKVEASIAEDIGYLDRALTLKSEFQALEEDALEGTRAALDSIESIIIRRAGMMNFELRPVEKMAREIIKEIKIAKALEKKKKAEEKKKQKKKSR